MHELSIAQAVLEIACRHAAGRRVTAVYLKVGHLRQVVPAALTFSFELVAQGTPVEGAALRIEAVPARGRCRRCGEESLLEALPLRCEACGAFELSITAGEELFVESLEMEEDENGGGCDEDSDRRSGPGRERRAGAGEPGEI